MRIFSAPERNQPLLFNTALETGVRAVINLEANFPKALSLDRLVELDHLVVHVSDLGGPSSVHPDIPKRATEMIVRRGVIERGLLLMESRGLVARVLSDDGIRYQAGEEAGNFVGWLKADYSNGLKESAKYLASLLDRIGDSEFDQLVAQQFERWALEFQPVERMGPELP
jgi:ABC-three component (ABC-3C) system Middle Component 2